MRKIPLTKDRRFRIDVRMRLSARILMAPVFFCLFFQPGCLFRKHQAPAAPTLPARVSIVLLPLNVPQENADLRWLPFAGTVLMATEVQAAPDLDTVPLWSSVPAVLQALGTSRTITSDIAASTATRMSAKWATQGDIMPAKTNFTLRLDFIPSESIPYPYRYQKEGSVDALESRIQEAISQFLNYLIVRPLMPTKVQKLDAQKLKAIAQALDAEYGWYVPARPGEAVKEVEDLARTNRDLARLLFNPALYPVLAK